MRIRIQAKRPLARTTYGHLSEGHPSKEQGYGTSRAYRVHRRMMIGAIGRGRG